MIKVADTAAITVGQWVRIFQKDPGDGSLMFELNGNAMAVSTAQEGHPDPCRFITRVVAKGADWIRTERIVPFKVRHVQGSRYSWWYKGSSADACVNDWC